MSFPDEPREELTEERVLRDRLRSAERDTESILKRYVALEARCARIRDAWQLYNTGKLALDEFEGVMIEELER